MSAVETGRRAAKAPPCTMVIFGAGGDLTKRLLMPAIYNLEKGKLLSDNFAIVAAGAGVGDETSDPVGEIVAIGLGRLWRAIGGDDRKIVR